MATKKPTTRKRSTKSAATSTEKARAAAIKEIDDRLAGKEKPKPASKGKRGASSAKKPAAASTAKAETPKKAKRSSGLDLAAKVLSDAKEPMNAKDIAQKAIAAGWKTSGKTPHATLYAAMIREISAKGNAARFKKTDRGLFTARSGGGKGA